MVQSFALKEGVLAGVTAEEGFQHVHAVLRSTSFQDHPSWRDILLRGSFSQTQFSSICDGTSTKSVSTRVPLNSEKVAQAQKMRSNPTQVLMTRRHRQLDKSSVSR
ncbi:hypothetical protein F7725_015881 [Dissostichus mawsoni]|uniref:Uncharacterized protein n=1 Tax=Dissostichus mawsoni TaxID=36200 RepID=A0A7J5YIT0_DISMA|nr:hypothetical protein F7725_015881 [Dissostichus mawsoni]